MTYTHPSVCVCVCVSQDGDVNVKCILSGLHSNWPCDDKVGLWVFSNNRYTFIMFQWTCGGFLQKHQVMERAARTVHDPSIHTKCWLRYSPSWDDYTAPITIFDLHPFYNLDMDNNTETSKWIQPGGRWLIVILIPVSWSTEWTESSHYVHSVTANYTQPLSDGTHTFSFSQVTRRDDS